MRHPLLVERRPNGTRQLLASTLSAPRVAATSYCDPGRHANFITRCLLTPCLLTPCLNVPDTCAIQTVSTLIYVAVIGTSRKRGNFQTSIGHEVPWKTGMPIHHTVDLQPFVFPQKECSSPCNFATSHLTACILKS